MKTLENHTLIIDAECPLCRAYSAGFVKTGMLDQNGRQAYQNLTDEISANLDINRSRNEIALVNRKTGHVYYGVESLFSIIQHSFPVFKPLFAFSPFRFLMKKFYSFISYNRKVIMPGKPENDVCTPDFNIRYRLIWIVLTWLFTSLILTKYAMHLRPLLPETHFYREFLVCGGQILFQGSILFFLAREKMFDYLGNMMTITFAGSLLLLFGMWLGAGLQIREPMVYGCFFGLVVGLMFLEHARRMTILKLGWTPSFTWVLYRFLILTLIL